MSDHATASVPPEAPPAPAPAGDVGFDRPLAVSLARIPFLAVLWVAGGWAASAAADHFGWHLTVRAADGAAAVNPGPLAVIAFGMLLAAFIDGYKFKVPNWVTLALVLSGWYIGLMHDVGWFAVPGATAADRGGLASGYGGLAAAVGGTAVGFLVLFPALAIGGMGQGDVKMAMGFGSWLGAYFGFLTGAGVLVYSSVLGILTGGVFGLVMMAFRRQFYKNLQNTREILTDLQVLVKVGPEAAARRASGRRQHWVRLPYGVPMCVGFLGYLWYRFFVAQA